MADLIEYQPVFGGGPLGNPPLYGIIDPDYARIYTQARIIAWQYGFCLVMQGSFTRDLDLLMVPWEERAYEKIVPAVINRIAQATGTTVNGEPKDKPHGRKAYTLALPGFHDPRWVDLSVMPCAPSRKSADTARHGSDQPEPSSDEAAIRDRGNDHG
jgi:hypothetical protein